MHEFWSILFDDRRILVPVKNPKQILDIGCGTGAWAVELADEISESYVYGIDLSPVQPVYVPDNCIFILENILRGSSFPDDKFDLIQSRCIGAGIPDHRWLPYIKEIWRLTKPGGWIQLIEIDPIRYCDDSTMPEDSPLAKCERIVQRVLKDKYSITSHGALDKLAKHVQRAGFIEINQFNFKAPIGKWAQDTGYLIFPLRVDRKGCILTKCTVVLIRSIKHILRDGMPGTGDGEIEDLINDAQSELQNADCHTYLKMFIYPFSLL